MQIINKTTISFDIPEDYDQLHQFIISNNVKEYHQESSVDKVTYTITKLYSIGGKKKGETYETVFDNCRYI